MAFGTSTDPYQPAEKTWRIARSVLEVLAEHDHPVSIVTTSALVVRDLDLPSALAAKVSVSITTLDPALARAMEPRAAARQRRLEGMQEVAAAAAGASSAG